MRILHLMLSNFYIDGYNYQENILTRQNKIDGHTVKIIASTETFIDNKSLGYIKPKEYINEDGIEVARIPYRKILPHFMIVKIRAYPNVYEMIEEFQPDVILHHGVPSYELLNVIRYKKNHPKVKLYLDSHETFLNSATNYISKQYLHRGFYRYIVQKALPYVDKILCTSYSNFDFLQEMYDIPIDIMEYYPLGGILINEPERKEIRNRIREELELEPDQILMVHSGKLDALKRTEELLLAFSKINNRKLNLLIIGSLSEDVRIRIEPIIKSDDRIKCLGWKESSQLLEYLCACDIYLQPGGPSATMQNAVCCGSAVAVTPIESHKYLLKDSAFYIKTIDDMKQLFKQIIDNPEILLNKQKQSKEIAKTMLDYKSLAARLYK